MRLCPFCAAGHSKRFGERAGVRFERCLECHSIFMQVSREHFERLHDTSWETDEFLRRMEAAMGNETPDGKTWSEVAAFLPRRGPILEIGPGSGHLLAAAKEDGREVVGVETCSLHRQFIRETWGIESVYDSLDRIQGRRFAGIVVINTLEHIYDIEAFLKRLSGYLDPCGAVFVSTCNAGALLANMCRTMWAMFKPPDHVSFPSARGIRSVSERAGLRAVQVWTHELPFETPLGIAVAVRDWTREHRASNKAQPTCVTQGGSEAPAVERGRTLSNFALRLRPLDFSTPLTSSLGVASSIKAVLMPQ